MAQAARHGHPAMLVALRNRLADAVNQPDVPARDLAALARRLVDVSAEVDRLVADYGPDVLTHTHADGPYIDTLAAELSMPTGGTPPRCQSRPVPSDP